MNDLAIGDIVAARHLGDGDVAQTNKNPDAIGVITEVTPFGRGTLYSVLINGELGKEHESTFMLNYYSPELTKTHNIDDIDNQIKALTEL